MRKFITHFAALAIGIVSTLSVVGGISMYDNLPFRLAGANPGHPEDLQAYMFVKVDYGSFAVEAPPGRVDLLAQEPVQRALAYSMERTGLSKLPAHFRIRYATSTDLRIGGYARVINLPGQDPLIFVDSKWQLEERVSVLQHEFVHLLVASRYGHLYSGLDEGYAEWASVDPTDPATPLIVDCKMLSIVDFNPLAVGAGRSYGKLLFTIEERRGGPNAAHLLFDQLTGRPFNDLTWRSYLTARWGCPPLLPATVKTPTSGTSTVPSSNYVDNSPRFLEGD